MGRFWAVIPFLISPFAVAQQPCADGIRIEGTVIDPSGAVIRNAKIRAGNQAETTTSARGGFVLACVPVGLKVSAHAPGFDSSSVIVKAPLGGVTYPTIQLAIANAETVVQVRGDTPSLDDKNDAGTIALDTKQMEQLPDDPDDLLTQLQQMAASAGGTPAITILTVNGRVNRSG